jgi:phosphoadenosine phosphosulfate reductase
MTVLEAREARYATAATRELAEAADRRFAGAHPIETLAWSARTFGPRIAVASSMADEVVVHLASQAAPGIDVVFLDTGYHFPETIEFRRRVAERLDVNVIDVAPVLSVAAQDARFGAKLHDRDPDACCEMRKVQPLARALEGYDAWVSGVRRDEAATRADTRTVMWDRTRGKVKVNPIAHWTEPDVAAYAKSHGLRFNPLRELGFTSIGCAPCTVAVRPGDDPRAGRWDGFAKTECGLHA